MITLPVLQAVSRRAALRGIVAVSASGLVPSGGAQAQDRYDVRELLRLEWPGQVSLLHIGPLQGELMPHYHRPSGDRIRSQDVEGLTGEALRVRYGIGGRNPMDYALTHEAIGELARIYGKMGGIDRMAAVLDGIRRQRPDALVLMGQGDETGPLDGFWGGAQSVSDAQNALRADVTLGAHAPSAQVFERGGERIAIIKHDRKGSVEALQQHVQDQKAAGVVIVVILSDVKLREARDLAENVTGVNLIFADDVPLPEAVRIGATRIITSGAQGRFVTRFDFDMVEGKVTEVEQRLILVFAEIMPAEPQMVMRIKTLRAPFLAVLSEPIGRAGVLLYQASAVRSTWDDLICNALRAELRCEIALWPAQRAGRTMLAGQAITREDILSVTGKYRVTRTKMTGRVIKGRLEAQAEMLVNPAPNGGHLHGMIRVGGLAFMLDLAGKLGARILDLKRESGAPLKAEDIYTLATVDGSVGSDPSVSNIVEGYISKRGRVGQGFASAIQVIWPN